MIFFEIHVAYAYESRIIPLPYLVSWPGLHCFEGSLINAYPRAKIQIGNASPTFPAIRFSVDGKTWIQLSAKLMYWLSNDNLEHSPILVVVEDNVANYRELIP